MVTYDILNKVKANIKNNSLLEKGDTVVIGVSGGADSVMLLDVMYKLSKEYELNLKVAHVNHKIRKGDAEADAEFVKSLSIAYNLPFFLKEANVPEISKTTGTSEEKVGRSIRYDFFNSIAAGGKIATAHNANDNAETILMHLIRGSGLNGLSGIPVKRDNIIRPILPISRQEIEDYLKENELTHITDKTNFEDIYFRNKIRLKLIPEIQTYYNNPAIINTLNANAISYRDDNDFLESETSKAFSSNVTIKDGSVFCPKSLFKDLHPAIAKRLIIKCVQTLFGRTFDCIGPEKVEEFYNGVSSKTGKTFLISNGYQMRVLYDDVVFEKIPEVQENIPEVKIELIDTPQQFSFDNKNFVCEVVETDMIDNNAFELYLPYEEFAGKTLTMRTRNSEDVFRVKEDMSSRVIHFLGKKKVPLADRDSIPMLVDDKVLWAVGVAGSRFKDRSGKFFKFTLV